MLDYLYDPYEIDEEEMDYCIDDDEIMEDTWSCPGCEGRGCNYCLMLSW